MSRDPVTNHSALSTRATALQRAIEEAFRSPSKRTLKHTEAMDILARIDGFRNREAAHAAEGATDAVAPPTAAAGATTPFDPDSLYFEFDIPFEDGMGFLGARTNGAPPQSVSGISVECSADTKEENWLDPDWVEEEDAGFWLRAVYGKGNENMAYVSGWKKAKSLLAMLIEAEYHQTHGTMLGVTAYPNDAQLEFAGDRAEVGPDEDVRFTCIPLRGGFELAATAITPRPISVSMRNAKTDAHPVVARLEGSLGKAGVHALSKRIQQADAWFVARRHARWMQLEAIRKAKATGQPTDDH